MDRELLHIRTALQHCQFPEWPLNQWQHKFTHPNQPNTTTTNKQQQFTSQQQKEHHHCSSVHAQHMRKVQETVQKERHTRTLQGHQRIKDSTRKPQKDKDPKNNQTGIIYHYQCPKINCPSAYIGESGRSLGERVKEHFKTPSPIHLHSTTTGHPTDPEQFNIVHKEVNSQSRTIKEAMFICVQDPTLNRNLGKYQLPHIWDHLLQVSPTLQCKPSSHSTTPPHLTPPPTYWFPPYTFPSAVQIGGAHTFMVSTHIYPKHTPYTPNTPTLNLQQVLQQHHLGTFLIFYFLG